MDIAALRARKGKNKLELSAKALKSNTNSFVDDRYWSLQGDEAGNGSAVIRFLPSVNDDDLDYEKIFSHRFKCPTGKWYIQNSLTTLGLPDPVGEDNSKLWNTGDKEKQEIVRQRKRRLHHISNILVINDPKNPANNGKVFLFKYGKKILDKINDMAFPDPAFGDEEPIDVFDPWDGADFKFKMRQVEGYANYDKSEFSSPTPLAGGDEEKMLEILNSRYDIKAEVAADKFKSYDELNRIFQSVVNGSSSPVVQTAEDDLPVEQPVQQRVKSSPEPKAKESAFESTSTADLDDDDDDMAFFQKLAN